MKKVLILCAFAWCSLVFAEKRVVNNRTYILDDSVPTNWQQMPTNWHEVQGEKISNYGAWWIVKGKAISSTNSTTCTFVLKNPDLADFQEWAQARKDYTNMAHDLAELNEFQRQIDSDRIDTKQTYNSVKSDLHKAVRTANTLDSIEAANEDTALRKERIKKDMVALLKRRPDARREQYPIYDVGMLVGKHGDGKLIFDCGVRIK